MGAITVDRKLFTRGLLILTLVAGVLSAGGLIAAARAGQAQVETVTRFLEFDQIQSILAYEISLHNRGSLPVSSLELKSEPTSLEGPWQITDLAKNERVQRRFSFSIDPEASRFQPSLTLSYVDREGEQFTIDAGQRHLAWTADFIACDVETGKVVMRLHLVNSSAEPLLFLELHSENPGFEEGSLDFGDLKPGERMTEDIAFQLPPGDTFFNPTLYLSYHALYTKGTRLIRNFYTFVQSDLNRIEAALSRAAPAAPISPAEGE